MIVKKRNLEFNVVDTVNEEWFKTNYPIWEETTFNIFDRELKPDMVYVDIGAYEGHTILYASQKVKKAYGVECDRLAYDRLSNNVKANNMNIELDYLAINDKDESVLIIGQSYDANDFGHSGSRIDKNGSMKVEGVTFETYLKRKGLEYVDFIKMDIEGCEEYVIPTMLDYLEKYKPIFYVSWHPHLMHHKTYDHLINSDDDENVHIFMEDLIAKLCRIYGYAVGSTPDYFKSQI